jgi:hypothetical protein
MVWMPPQIWLIPAASAASVNLSKHSVASAASMKPVPLRAFWQRRGIGIGGYAKRHRVSSEKSPERRRRGADGGVARHIAGEVRSIPKRLPSRIDDRRIRVFLNIGDRARGIISVLRLPRCNARVGQRCANQSGQAGGLQRSQIVVLRDDVRQIQHCPDGVQLPVLSAQKRAWSISCTVRWIEVVPHRASTCKRSASYWAEPSGGVCNGVTLP